MVTINKYIKALLHPAGGHNGSHKAHQAGNTDSHKIAPNGLNVASQFFPDFPLYHIGPIIKNLIKSVRVFFRNVANKHRDRQTNIQKTSMKI